MPKRLVFTLFYDTVCPYSWIAFEGLLRYRMQWNVELHLRPVFLNKILNTTGNFQVQFMLRLHLICHQRLQDASGSSWPFLTEIQSKSIHRDLKLMSEYWNIPFCISEDFGNRLLQNNSKKVQLLLTAVAKREPTKLVEVSRSVWMRFWKENQWTYRNEDVSEIAENNHLHTTIVNHSSIDSVEKALLAATDVAVKTGAFGTPWITVKDLSTNEVHAFFGSDRLPLIAQTFNLSFTDPYSF